MKPTLTSLYRGFAFLCWPHSLSSSLLPVQKLFAPILIELFHILFQRSWLPFTYIRLQLMRSSAPFPQFPDISRQNMLLKELLNQNCNIVQRNIEHVVACDCSPFIKKTVSMNTQITINSENSDLQPSPLTHTFEKENRPQMLPEACHFLLTSPCNLSIKPASPALDHQLHFWKKYYSTIQLADEHNKHNSRYSCPSNSDLCKNIKN